MGIVLVCRCVTVVVAAVAYGQPTEQLNLKALAKLPKEQRQCAANKFMLNKLAGLNSKDVAQPKDCGSDIFGCIANLAGTIAACVISVVQWELVVACVELLLVLVMHALTASVKL